MLGNTQTIMYSNNYQEVILIIAARQKGENMEDMNNKENSRIILALRERGWTDTEINDLVLYMETGEEK